MNHRRRRSVMRATAATTMAVAVLASIGVHAAPAAKEPADPVRALWARPTSGWTANEEYLGGTYVWTDQVFDDRGTGDATYPADGEPYMRNAADLVEVRVRASGRRELLVGVRLNTLLDPNVPVVSIGIVDPAASAARVPWPGSGVSASGVRWVVTLTNGAATLTDLIGGTSMALGAPVIRNDTGSGLRALENTITAAVPLRALGLRTLPPTFAIHAVAGVRDPGAPGKWFGDPAVYDVAFFRGETFGGWESDRQGELIAAGDLTAARGLVDLAVVDRPAAPKPGVAQSRIYRPSIEMQLGEGIAPNEVPVIVPAGEQTSVPQGDRWLGLFVPYAVWVPDAFETLPRPLPLFVQLHGLGGTHMSLVPEWTEGSIDVPALAVFPLGHADSGYYQGAAELDVLESLEDAKLALPVDSDRVFLSGISMGGIGTYTVGTHRPDLFAGAVPVVGPGSGMKDFLWPVPADEAMGKARDVVGIWRMGSFGREVLDNALNLPYRIFAGTPDPLTTVAFSEGDAARWEELGYDYQYGLFFTRTHEFFAPYVNTLYHQLLNGCVSDDVPAGCDGSLDPGGRARDENPARVIYKAVPFHWHGELTDKLVFDGAYWVDGMVLRDAPYADSYARVDVTSRALAGKSREQVTHVGPEARTFGPTGDAYKFQSWRWTAREGDAANGFDLTAENLASVTLDLARMQLVGNAPIAMAATGDGVTKLTLTNGGWTDGTVVRLVKDGVSVAEGKAQHGDVALDVTLGERADYVILTD